VTATARGTGSSKPRPVRPQPVTQAPSNGFPILRLKTTTPSRGKAKRVPLFYIDDTEYTMLAEPPAALALQYLDLVQRQGPDVGFNFAMDQMIGAEAYQELIHYDALTKDEFTQVAKVVTDHLLGALQDEGEDPKAT
jgi:hypothetical protein